MKAIVDKARSSEPPKPAKPAAATPTAAVQPSKPAVVEETTPPPVPSSPEKPPEADQGSKRPQPGKAEKPAQLDKPDKQEPPSKPDGGEGGAKKGAKSAKVSVWVDDTPTRHAHYYCNGIWLHLSIMVISSYCYC